MCTRSSSSISKRDHRRSGGDVGETEPATGIYSRPVTFDVAADAYDRFMGRYSVQLVPQMIELAGVEAGQTALDVGCGPGALTGGLAGALGVEAVAAVDPSASFIDANRRRHPGVDVRQATAEQLPFDDDQFDVALAQLVVHFMTDPVAGLAEMARVVRPGGVVAACVWDHAGGRSPVSEFWRAALSVDPSARDEAALNGARQGHLAELLAAAGLDGVHESVLAAEVRYGSFEEWWEPYTLGVGPAGGHLTSLDATRRAAVRDACRDRLGPPPFTISAQAWAARGTTSG
jgi:SAM-dependent methyltransferase